MDKYIRGDLLVYTNDGIKRIDKLSSNDLLLTENNKYSAITEFAKVNKKNYYLYKIKVANTIDNYYLDGNNKMLCIQNIPFDLKINDCVNFIKDNLRIASPVFTNVSNITDFDYVAFPYDDNNDNNDDNDDNDDKYRFKGLILLGQNAFSLNNNLNKNTIGFLNKYLHNNNIPYDIFNNNITTTIKFNLNDIPEINYLSKKHVISILKGFAELNPIVNTTNKKDFYILKNLFLKIGILISATFMNDNYLIKIPDIDNEINYNYFIYENHIWCKVKKITKVDKYTGVLYNLKTENGNFVSEIGVIS